MARGILASVSARDVLVVGNLRGASRSALTTALNGLKLNITEIANVDEATAALERQPWCAVLVDTTLSGASRFCTEARSHRHLLGLPMIALSPRLTDLAFLNALRWGADDVVALGASEALSVRLNALLAAARPAETPPSRGEAVVADPDRRRGNGLGRSIHSAGYSVRYATETTSARFYTTKSEVELFVFNAELSDPRAFIQEAQQNGCKARWVVLAKGTQTEELQKDLSSLKNVVVMSSGGPPENILFAVNLLFPSEASRRGEIRALFGTVVFFRAVGDYRDECGFSYTASPQGIYVRTLAPAPTDKVWVELIPPDGERRVRLVGKVAWSRPYGRQPGEGAPPGFGVRIVDGLGEDLALWSECLKGLEFRAPATLVPEARFSLPAAARPLSDAAPPNSLAALSVRQTVTTSVSIAPVLSASPPSSRAASPPLSHREGDPSPAPSTPQVPVPTSMDRLSAAAKARISTRPALRLSVPAPASLRRDQLTKVGRLSRPPAEDVSQPSEPPAEPAPVPKRVGQGRTVMGLGILQRDGSTVVRTHGDGDDRASLPPNTPESGALSQLTGAVSVPDSADSNGIRAADPQEGPRLPPVNARTLTYGTEPPVAFDNKFQAAADVLSSVYEDISDRPTLSDRLALESAEKAASQALTPAVPEAFDSLPPDALESDAPAAEPAAQAAPPRQKFPSRTSLTEVAALSALSETDRNWVGLEVIPSEQRLSKTDLPQTPPSAQQPSFAAAPDWGATLPGVVVDTVVPPDAESIGASGAPATQVANAPAQSTPFPSQVRYAQLSPELRAPQELQEPERRSKRRSAFVSLAVAVVFATLVVGLMIRTKPAPETKAEAPKKAAIVPPAAATPPAVPQGVGPKPPVASSAAFGSAPPIQPGVSGAPTPEKVAPPPPAEPGTTAQVSPTPDVPGLPTPTNSEPPRDPGSLPAKSAWLYVQTPVAARVFVHGVDAGTTNTWLETACGTRFVRLGRAPGDWLSAGVPTIIRCRSANTIEVPYP